MTVYKERSAGVFKFIFAIIIFILAMTITFASAEGISYSKKNPDDVSKTDLTTTINEYNSSPIEKAESNTVTLENGNNSLSNETYVENSTQVETLAGSSSVPEPGTIILISGGLGMLYLNRSRKKV